MSIISTPTADFYSRHFIFTEKDTNIEAGLYQYDVKIYLSDGRRDRLITPSEFEIFEGVTHD